MQIGVKFLRIGSSGGLLWTVMNHQVPWKVENFLTSWPAISFSRRTLLHGVNYNYPFHSTT